MAAPKAKETCREIAQHLTHLNTYVTGALIVLLALTVLTFQRLAEERRENGKHAVVVAGAEEAVTRSENEIGRLRTAFLAAIKLANRASKRIDASRDDVYVFGAALDALEPKSGPDTRNALIAIAAARLRALTVADDQFGRAEVLFQKTVAQAHDLLRAREVRDAKREALQAVSNEKSFPSPVGEINLDPKTALVCLAIMAAAGYVFLVVASRRLLARIPPGGETVSVVPPVWLYAHGDDCRRSLGWQPEDAPDRLTSAVAIHATWLALSFGLLGALFDRSAYEGIAFLPPEFIKAAAVAINVTALLAFLSAFLPPAIDDEGKTSTFAGRARRAAIVMLTAGAVGFPLMLILRRRGPPGARKVLLQPVPPANERDLIRNSRNGVVHHPRVCRFHLPVPPNRAAAAPGTQRFHESVQTEIALAILDESHGKPANSALLVATAETLTKAIKTRPLSWHLHDRLIRIYGALKEYGKIEELLVDALAEARKHDTLSGRRAAAAFEFRLARTARRKAAASKA